MAFVSAQDYLTVGANINLLFNGDQEVIDETSLIFPVPSIFLEYNTFKEDRQLGFHLDGGACFVYEEEDSLMLGLDAMIGPSFTLFPQNQSDLIISAGVTAGFMLGGTFKSEDTGDSAVGFVNIGVGSKIKYILESGLTLGLNFNYYPFMYVSSSKTENTIEETLEKEEQAFSVGISIGYTQYN
ncbi:hypothetical protein [Treponema sp.]|uniref:hypothetical protein n=1 Tax=Treponema sp. TaxID=166 RepID=UPI0025CE7B3E|nr:hypothetical protein [Treponema sp.]MCR5218371.1 hypothetical protein [Treponema sp.]